MSFPPGQLYCVLDYESYSEADLKKTGSYKYSLHASTEIICAAWRIGTRDKLRDAETVTWTPALDGVSVRGALMSLGNILSRTDVVVIAHNALFEQVITRNVLKPKYLSGLGPTPPARWLCTAALAAAMALPRKLEHAAQALRLPVQKDMEGHKLMLKYCKPRKPSKHNPATRHVDLADIRRITEYCATDIATEVELFLKARPLSPPERAIWELDQKINLRGFSIDRELVETVIRMVGLEQTELQRRAVELGGGAIRSTGQVAALLDWLSANGCFLPDLRKKTVEDAIADGLAEGAAREMLELRLSASKTSVKKYPAFLARAADDGRVRDNFVYHGPSTGRWSAAGVQVQNLPRGVLKEPLQAAEMLRAGDLEMVRLCYGEPMNVFSACLRNMIIASPGKTLDVADFAAIEARVLFWLAKHEAGLTAFRDGRDLYRELAARIFNTTIDRVTGDQRFVGKTATLGCGYQMGWKKFRGSCQAYGQEVSDELAQAAVAAYRETHKPVTVLWDMLGRAAIAAVENLGKRFTIYRTAWWVKGGILWCQLPSGRRLAYPQPSVRWEPTEWGEKRQVLQYFGVNATTKRWGPEKTYGGKLTENVVQAIARDVMAAAMQRIEAAGWEIAIHVHDELVGEIPKTSKRTNAEFCALMSEVPEWAEGLPVKVEGWRGERYKK